MLAASAALTLTAATTPASAAPGAAGPGDPAATAGPAAAAAGTVVPLITGDRVVLGPDGRVTGLLRAEGREHIPVRVLPANAAGDIHVLPLDALPLIESGKLDQRLFNVTALSREEYTATGGVPLIVSYSDGAGPAGAGRTRQELHREAEPEVRAELESLDGEALLVDDDEAADAWQALTDPAGGDTAPGIESIALDGLQRALLDHSTGQIGAPAAWQAGLDGTGVTIAVLDTGIDTGHGDFAGKVLAEADFTGGGDPGDVFGHGTHVASIAAGTGARSGGTHQGVAPGAALLNAKVLDDVGDGFESQVIEGMEWAVAQGADIVNMSLGWPWVEGADPLGEAMDRITAETDALFVVAAGNEGFEGPGSLRTPATSDGALTVGAVDRDDRLAGFSSLGPRRIDGAPKPDITAPGVDIAAATVPGSAVEAGGEIVADGYVTASGTSMAAPHVAGAAAVLAQAHPDWNDERLKSALLGSALPLAGYSVFEAGAGRLDLARAMEQRVTAGPASLYFGRVEYPHDTADPVVRELTYTNTGDTDVTLELSADGIGPLGGPAPEGMFTLSAEQVTVPAGDTATVRVTADTTPGGELHGAYSVFVTAEGDGQRVRTAGAVHREPEKADLTIAATGRDGEPADWWQATVTELATGEVYSLLGEPDGDATLRLPTGDYAVETLIHHGDPAEPAPLGTDLLVRPSLVLEEDITLESAAGQARDMVLTMPDSRLGAADLSVYYQLADDSGAALPVEGSHFLGALPEGVRTAQLGDAPPGWSLTSGVSAHWGLPEAGREYIDYHAKDDGFYTGLEQHTGKRELAKVTTRVGSSVEGKEGVVFTSPVASGGLVAGPIRPLPYVSDVWLRAGGTTWSQSYLQFQEDFLDVISSAEPATFRAGRRYTRTFNTGVMGPTLHREQGRMGVFRSGDTLSVLIPTFADGTGRLSSSEWDWAQTVLYRDGEVWDTESLPLMWTEFEVPADEAEYRLVHTTGRAETGVAAVSTEVVLDYTFTSAHAEEEVRIPVSAVRFTPWLALDSTSPGGRKVRVPLRVEGAAAGGNLGSLTVEVSSDRGESWRPVKVRGGKVTVTNPPAGGSVSLRATITDKQGNTSVQTLIDAYLTR